MLQHARWLRGKLVLASLLASMAALNASALADEVSANDNATTTQINAKDHLGEAVSPTSRIKSSFNKSKQCSALLADLARQRLSNWLYKSYMINSSQHAVTSHAYNALEARTELYCNEII